MRRCILAVPVLTAAFVSITAASGAAAQATPTCGWDVIEDVQRPPTVRAVVDRGPVPPEVEAAVSRLDQWFLRCNHTAARTAVQEMRRYQTRRNSSDPQLRALIGIALLRGPDVQVERAEGPILRPLLHQSNAERDGMRLLLDVAREQAWPEVLEELALFAMAVREPDVVPRVLEVLRTSAEDERSRVLLAELELIEGLLAEARGSAASAAARGSARALRVVSVAAALESGEGEYLRALAQAQNGWDLAPFYDDIRVLLDTAEIREWRGLRTVEERAAWMRRKWEWRAVMAGIDAERRIAEHHRRMRVAAREYRRDGNRGAPFLNAVWLLDPNVVLQPLDDRGIIYVRHGPPDTVLSMPHHRGLVAWYYGGYGPARGVFEFAREDFRGWMLMEPSPLCRGGDLSGALPFDPAVRGLRPARDPYVHNPRGEPGTVLRADIADWAMTLQGYDPQLSNYYFQCASGSFFARSNYQPLRAEARLEGQVAMSTETAVPRYRSPLAGAMNLYGFRTGGTPEMVAYLAVPGDSLTGRALTDGAYEYALNVRLAGGDPVTEEASVVDTVVRFRQPARLPAGAVVSMPLSLRPPDGADVRTVLSVVNAYDSAQGQVMSGLRRMPPASAALAMSDIVVAHDRAGPWLRRGVALAPVVGHAVVEGASFLVYHELYGAERDDPLQVEIQITPGREESVLRALREWLSRRTAQVVQFAEAAEPQADGTVVMSRVVGMDLEPGTYVLHVRVTNGRTGASTAGETSLVVVEAR